ncbi:MAG TPA: cadmium-translocating P-type ATPase [Clostridiales bacterium]|nr:cadmium-translocating P-type ATPase [Clostridiales bacterium]
MDIKNNAEAYDRTCVEGHSCNCSTGHCHDHERSKKDNIMIAIAGLLFILGLILRLPKEIELILFLTSYIVAGGNVILTAIRNISKGKIFDENFLMSIATIGAFVVGEYAEGAAVMIFYRIGEYFQDLAVDRSMRSIQSLMDIRPDEANLIVDGIVKRVAAEDVSIGDTIVIKPGEKIPLDGVVVSGISHVDTSALTGEFMPRAVEAGDEVLSGFVNSGGALTVEVREEFSKSAASKIIELMQNASTKKAPTEQFITRFAAYYTPIVVGIAFFMATLIPIITGDMDFSKWIYRALVFLVISCPCAMVVSIPLSFFAGLGSASKKGILIKGGNYLEALNNVNTVVFDKTGTLTKGSFEVVNCVPAEDITAEELIKYAVYGEALSNHPIAQSIRDAYGKDIDRSQINSYEEIAGLGIKANVAGREILTGNMELMNREGISNIEPNIDNIEGTVVYVAVDGKYVGYIELADVVKEDSKYAIKKLKDMGISETIMLTGDNESIAQKVGDKLGIDKVYASLLPNEKLEKLEAMETELQDNGIIAFIGDGINDSPAIARAKVGVAMGGLGADAAIEAADVVLMTDQVSKLTDAIEVARKTRRIVMQNIIFAIGVKVFVLILGALGFATMWQAVFADVGVTVIAVLNSMRILIEPSNKIN